MDHLALIRRNDCFDLLCYIRTVKNQDKNFERISPFFFWGGGGRAQYLCIFLAKTIH